MLFVLNAFDNQGQEREFSFNPKTIELGFDFLSMLVSRGHTLLSAYILEAGQRLILPPEAFDGQPASPAIQALQTEWQAVLDISYCEAVINENQRYLAQLQIRQCERRIKQHKRMIRWLSQVLQRGNSGITVHTIDLLTYHQNQLIDARLQMRSRKNQLN